jgi:hypothetical protein
MPEIRDGDLEVGGLRAGPECKSEVAADDIVTR